MTDKLMLGRIDNSSANERGSALAEFALVVVLLFVMLFGIVDFGRALYTYHFLSNAARDATRWASVNGAACVTDGSCPNGAASGTAVGDYVASIVPPGIDPRQLQVTADWPGGASCTGLNSPGCPVEVTLTYRFNFLTPIIVRGGTIQMSSSSEMIISH